MAIDTTNKKLALMEWGQVGEPGLPISPGTFGQDDKQQLLWGYPGVLWTSIVGVGGHLVFKMRVTPALDFSVSTKAALGFKLSIN